VWKSLRGFRSRNRGGCIVVGGGLWLASLEEKLHSEVRSLYSSSLAVGRNNQIEGQIDAVPVYETRRSRNTTAFPKKRVIPRGQQCCDRQVRGVNGCVGDL